jgi:hypothetical protein
MKRILHPLLLLCLILSLTVAGCGAQRQATSDKAVGAGVRGPAMAPVEQAPGAPAAEDSYDYAGNSASQSARKIILTANLQLVVKDTENTVAAIKGLVAAEEGFVAASNVWRDGSLLQAQLTVRVPAERMDAVVAEVKKLAVRVEREESGGQDVTEEYVDLSAQLRNLEATETELRALLTDVREKSGKAEDVMAVYRELVNIRGEIERTKGRIQYLDRSTELATITLLLSERAAEPIGQPGWQPLQTLRRALNALVELLKGGVDAGIWAVTLGGTLLGIPALAIWLLWRLTRGRRALRAKARAAEEELRREES